MQLESLKIFCDVVETGSFSKSARLNQVTQSAVSQQIRALETRFQKRLLSRSSRSALPTPSGSRLYRAGKEILQSFAALESALREESDQAEGEVVVATIYSVGLHELAPDLRVLLKRFPKVNVRLTYRRSDQVVDDVLGDFAHLGIVAYPAPIPGTQIVPFRSDELALVCAKDHPLAGRKTVRLADLAGLRFVAWERGLPTAKAIDRILRSAQVKVEVAMELDNIETIKRAVELGLGVTILPQAAVQAEESLGALVSRPLADGPFVRPIGLLVRKGRFLDRAASAVLEVLTESKR